MNETTTCTTAAAEMDSDYGLTYAVVTAVAEAEEVSPLDLQPLARVIDPDDLEALAGGPDPRTTPPAQIEFQYCGYDVTVTGGGSVSLADADSSE